MIFLNYDFPNCLLNFFGICTVGLLDSCFLLQVISPLIQFSGVPSCYSWAVCAKGIEMYLSCSEGGKERAEPKTRLLWALGTTAAAEDTVGGNSVQMDTA